MKKYIFMLLVGLMSVSCVDTVILPNDKTVEEVTFTCGTFGYGADGIPGYYPIVVRV